MRSFLLNLIISSLYVARCTYGISLSGSCTGTCQDLLKDKVEPDSTITVHWDAPELSSDTPMTFSLWWGYSPQSKVSLIGHFSQSARALDGRLQLEFPKLFIPGGDYYHIAVIPGSSSNSTNGTTATPQPENLLGPIKYYAGQIYGFGGVRQSLTVSVCSASTTGACSSGSIPVIDSNEVRVTYTNAATDLTYDSAEIKLHWGSPVYYDFNGPWDGEITYNQVLSASANTGENSVNLPIAQDAPPGTDYYVVVSLKRGGTTVTDMGTAVSACAPFALKRETQQGSGGNGQGSGENDQSSGHNVGTTGAVFITTILSAIVSMYFVM